MPGKACLACTHSCRGNGFLRTGSDSTQSREDQLGGHGEGRTKKKGFSAVRNLQRLCQRYSGPLNMPCPLVTIQLVSCRLWHTVSFANFAVMAKILVLKLRRCWCNLNFSPALRGLFTPSLALSWGRLPTSLHYAHNPYWKWKGEMSYIVDF